jgi:hypothetical protein
LCVVEGDGPAFGALGGRAENEAAGLGLDARVVDGRGGANGHDAEGVVDAGVQ